MFFTQISQLMTQGVDLTIVIRRKENELMVSTLPKSNGLKDDAQYHIVPLTLTGSPTELDAGFLQAIAQPMRKTTGLIVNLEQFEQQTAIASANSKAAKDAQAKESKEEKEKREKCEKFIKKADELIVLKKFDEALLNLQQARLYATEQVKRTVDDKIADVRAKLNQGSLFAMEELPPVRQTQQQPIQQTIPQQPSPQPSTAPTVPPMKFEDECRYPSATAPQTFNPDYCRADEYEEYPDFPVNMHAPMYNQTTPQNF